MSQSLWQIGRPDLNAFFLTFFFFSFFLIVIVVVFWAADVSDLCRSQLWNRELGFWMNKIQDRTQSWKSLLFKAFTLCLSYLFLYILTSKFIKKLNKKKISKQKKFKPWILLNQTCTEKQMRAAALRHWIYFFGPKLEVLYLHVQSIGLIFSYSLPPVLSRYRICPRKFKRGSVVAAILPSHMEESYCTSRFFL